MQRFAIGVAMWAGAAWASEPAPADSVAVSPVVALRASPADSLAARIAAADSAGAFLADDARRLFRELVAAARELLADGDTEAALLVLEDARALLPNERR